MTGLQWIIIISILLFIVFLSYIEYNLWRKYYNSQKMVLLSNLSPNLQ